MFAKHTAGASFIVGAQMLACVLAAGFVLTHFHNRAEADIAPPDDSHVSDPSRSLAYATRRDPKIPCVMLRAGPIAVPMTGVGPGPQGTLVTDAARWRIVDEGGRILAHGAVSPDVNVAAFSNGFTVRATRRATPFKGVSTSLLAIQAAGDPAKLAGHRYALEQSDCGRPDYGLFEIVAPPPQRY